VKVLDLNILIHAVNRDSPLHANAKAWTEAALSSDETIALPWVVVLGFLRVTTNPRILVRPITVDQAVAAVDAWLALPNVVVLSPSDGHWDALRTSLRAVGTAGNLTTDAHLATIAIENDAELCSADGDFARFSRLRWVNPMASNA
jgi:hypothetical protein